MTTANIVAVRAADDVVRVARLFRAYALSLQVDLGYQSFDEELAGLPGAYAPPDGELLLAISAEGEPIGCAALRKLAEAGEMKRLFVTPAGRGTGLGRALAVAVIAAARRAGYRQLRLDTLPGMQAAQALYRTLGFIAIPAYYDTPVAGTVFMSLDLA